jgi:hypothetical protein
LLSRDDFHRQGTDLDFVTNIGNRLADTLTVQKCAIGTVEISNKNANRISLHTQVRSRNEIIERKRDLGIRRTSKRGRTDAYRQSASRLRPFEYEQFQIHR